MPPGSTSIRQGSDGTEGRGVGAHAATRRVQERMRRQDIGWKGRIVAQPTRGGEGTGASVFNGRRASPGRGVLPRGESGLGAGVAAGHFAESPDDLPLDFRGVRERGSDQGPDGTTGRFGPPPRDRGIRAIPAGLDGSRRSCPGGLPWGGGVDRPQSGPPAGWRCAPPRGRRAARRVPGFTRRRAAWRRGSPREAA